MSSLVVDALSAWRLTHLLVVDDFPPIAHRRDALFDRLGPEHWGSYLATCVWCTGLWVAFGVRLARRVAPRAWGPVATALAVAAAVPILEAAVERLEGR